VDVSIITNWISLNLLAVFAVFIICTLLALRSGAGRLIALLLATVVAPLFVSLLSNTWLIGSIASTIPEWVLVIGFSVLLFILISRMTPDAFNEGGQPVQSLIAGLGTTLGLVALWAHQSSLTSLYPIPSILSQWFSSSYTLLWLIAAFLLLGFARRHARWL